MYSNCMYSCPLGRTPKSFSSTMFSWQLSRPTASISVLKRLIISGLFERCARIVLNTERMCAAALCCARYTAPMPPRPRTRTMTKLPITVPISGSATGTRTNGSAMVCRRRAPDTMRAARSTIDQAERKLKPRSRVPGSRCTFPYFSRSGAVFKISRETCCSHASGYACSWATNDGVEGRLSLSEQEPSTVTAPPDRRGGTYERDSTARAVLWYGTDTIHDLRREQKATTIGSDADRDIQIIAEHISGHHCRIENRARGTVLVDERSKNGTYYETRRSFGAGLKPSFDETRVPAEGFRLRPGDPARPPGHRGRGPGSS
ncbi:MAG: FHA domain-containing protein [Deltaproteobacteria bacterium]|nr:MAG: FHA domain-containing protein [Deltaproteobacteria bacterium]